MTNFSDQLFTDLMREHAATLQRTELPASSAGHWSIKRGAWLAGGAGTLAAGVTASLAAFGGGAAQAFAVTPHPDGTVTVSISDLSGISGANARLQDLGDRVVVVPVRAGCPSIWSLPRKVSNSDMRALHQTVTVRSGGSVGILDPYGSWATAGPKGNGTITIDPHGIPRGNVEVLAVTQDLKATKAIPAVMHAPKVIAMLGALTTPPAPACVSLQAPPGWPPSALPAWMVPMASPGPTAATEPAKDPLPSTNGG